MLSLSYFYDYHYIYTFILKNIYNFRKLEYVSFLCFFFWFIHRRIFVINGHDDENV